MLKQVTIAVDTVDPSSWQTYETEDVCELLKSQFQTWPETARIYHRVVAVECDVTPRCEADIERLLKLEGHFYVVVYPGAAALPYIVALVLAVASYLLAPSPHIPPTALLRNQSAQSPNNGLSDRTNQARINGRIPDIFGTVRSTPDLIASPYKVFISNQEVEYAYMCIGRGAYDIMALGTGYDIRDGDTPVDQIIGSSVAVYAPYTSPNSGDDPQLLIGTPIQAKVLNTRRSNSVTGQVLRAPNGQTFTGSVRFAQPNLIQLVSSSSIDLTQYFSSGDSVVITDAAFTAGSNTNIGSFSMTAVAGSGGLLEYVIPYFMISSIFFAGESIVITQAGSYPTTGYDISGTYTLSDVQIIDYGYGNKHARLILANHLTVAPDWSLVHVGDTILLSAQTADIVLANNIDLAGTYSITSVVSNQIALSGPAAINSDWNQSTWGTGIVYTPFTTTTTITSSGIKWIGPFFLNDPDMNVVMSNFVASNGLYEDDGTTQTAFSVQVQLELTSIDSSGAALGDPQLFPITITGSNLYKETLGTTLYATPTFTGLCSVRASRITATDTSFTGTVVDEVVWRDLYSSSPVTQTDFGNVTTVQSITYSTASSLAVKERKLNMLVQRKIPSRVTGTTFTDTLTGSNRADDIFMAICRDRYIGNREISEMDVDNIYDTVAAVETYFGSSKAVEFCYTFDNDNVSFEETANAVATAVFCIGYRRGNVIKLSFEKQTDDSTLLFNHRNKIPGSEKRATDFGNLNDNDGIEYTYVDPADDSIISIFLPLDYPSVNPKKIESVGQRNHLQSYFGAWRAWNRILYQKTTSEFDATQESELLLKNDRILNADNTRPDIQDGEVLDVATLELTLSQNVDLTTYTSYVIFLQHIDGIAESIDITAGSAPNKVVLATAPRLALVTADEKCAKTTYVIVGDTEPQQTAFLVAERAPGDGMTSTVTAINYDDRYYANDLDLINSVITEDGYGSGGGFTGGTGTGFIVLPTAPVLSGSTS